MQALTCDEHAEYNRLKKVTMDRWEAVREFAQAALEIKSRKLYRAEFDTWEAFCQSVLNFSVRHVDRLITAGAVSISGNVSISDIMSEKSAQVPANQGNDSAPSAEQVESQQEESAAKNPPPSEPPAPAPPPKPDIELDSTGFPIPAKCLPLWQRRPEVQKLLTAVSLLRTTLRAAQEADDPLWRPVTSKGETWATILKSFDQAYASLGLSIPYAVCPYCQGQIPDRCTNCHGRGFISEFFYKICVSSDAKKIRATVCKPKP